jgi:hypothetical protein
MAITLEQAKQLKPGTILYHATIRNADGTPRRYRVSGKPKTWKTRPNHVSVPLKWGLRSSLRMDETHLAFMHVVEADAIVAGERSREELNAWRGRHGMAPI